MKFSQTMHRVEGGPPSANYWHWHAAELNVGAMLILSSQDPKP